MKSKKIILAVLGVLLIIIILFFTVDCIRVNINTSPIFCVQTQTYDDGGSIEYTGLGYKVIKYVTLKDDTVKYKIGTWFMKFDNPFKNEQIQAPLPTYTSIKFDTKSIQTHLYSDNYVAPTKDVITSLSGIKKYQETYKDDKLDLSLNAYTEDYFNDKVLVIVTIQEPSGATTDKVGSIFKADNLTSLDIMVERNTAKMGTADMATWHLLVEMDKASFGNTDTISVLYTSAK